MHLDIRRQGIAINEVAGQRLARRLEMALGRVAHRLGRVWVHMGRGGDPGGELRCRVLARVLQIGDVLVEERGEELVSLIDRVAHRAGQAVRLALLDGRRSDRAA